MVACQSCAFSFFHAPATTEIYTLSLHDALPISDLGVSAIWLLPFYPSPRLDDGYDISDYRAVHPEYGRSEEHTSELQSPMYLVCRLLLEKKKTTASSGSSRGRWLPDNHSTRTRS